MCVKYPSHLVFNQNHRISFPYTTHFVFAIIGGMDFIMDYRLVYCLHNGLPLDQDVYDAAEWSSLVELSEVSILHGSAPVDMPDFTRGEWNKLNGVHFAL